MIPIFIPYVNRPDLLEKAVKSVPKSDLWHTLVINNSGNAVDVEAHYWAPDVPLTFAQTQNLMLKIAKNREQSFYLFMHNDCEASEGTVKSLIEMAAKLTIENRKWGTIFTGYDALAAFNTKAFEEVGGWDTELCWYASDCDVYYRLRLAGYELVESNLPVKHEPSQTLNSDPEIRRRVDLMMPFRQYYYQEKWGAQPGSERFLKPFNR